MPIRIDSLRSAASRYKTAMEKSLNEVRTQGLPTIFLCHSHRDEALVKGLIVLWEETGWRVYVDWADASMPESPTSETAQRIKQKIVETNYFVFLATPNSMGSRWCPWEIGFADGKKRLDRIILIPTIDGLTTYGSEYLNIDQHMDLSQSERLGVWQPGQTNGLLLETLKG